MQVNTCALEHTSTRQNEVASLCINVVNNLLPNTFYVHFISLMLSKYTHTHTMSAIA